jgi:hypothetical protein
MVFVGQLSLCLFVLLVFFVTPAPPGPRLLRRVVVSSPRRFAAEGAAPEAPWNRVRWRSLAAGKRADLLFLDPDLQIARVFVDGEPVS